MQNKIKIVFLYSELMDYTVGTVNSLVNLSCDINIIHWDKKKLTPYYIENNININYYNRSEFNYSLLITKINKIKPDIIFISGWMDYLYLRVVLISRLKGVRIVCGFDDIIKDSFKQNIAFLLGKLGFFKLFYNYAWISGYSQYEYVKKIGFKNQEIIYDLYSANLTRINKFSKFDKRDLNYPHVFLFVGRLCNSKGLDTLLKAWNNLNSDRMDWRLRIIGNGSIKIDINSLSNVEFFDFLQPDELIIQYLNSGCLVMPSKFEPWGVVLHEGAASKLPIIASCAVNSASKFLINGYNGYIFEKNNHEMLTYYLKKIIQKSDDELRIMGNFSKNLSLKITPESSARNLLSILE